MSRNLPLSRREMLTGAACLGGTALLSATSGLALAETNSKVVVELFSSQACPKCPPANAFLAELAKNSDVIALCLPVGLWDFMGWKEEHATPTFSERQIGYAQRLSQRAPFTPQMVIDGRVSEWGTRRTAVLAAIQKERARAQTRVPVSVRTHREGLLATIGKATFTGEAPASVYCAALKSDFTIDVAGGVNKGKSFAYPNMVTSLHRVGAWQGDPLEITLARPVDKGAPADGVAIIVQEGVSGPILGAALHSFLS